MHPLVLEFVVFEILFQTILFYFTTMFQYASCLVAYGDNHEEDGCCICGLRPVRCGKFDRHLLSLYCAISKLCLCFDNNLGRQVVDEGCLLCLVCHLECKCNGSEDYDTPKYVPILW